MSGARCVFSLPSAVIPKEHLWTAEFTARGLRRLTLSKKLSPEPLPRQGRDRRWDVLTAALAERMAGRDSVLPWDFFDLPRHTGFQQRVWRAIHAIPSGRTATYAQIAAAAGSPFAFRACGQACGANPILLFIPCHRVVSASGLGGFGLCLDIKKWLLRLEGVDLSRLSAHRLQ